MTEASEQDHGRDQRLRRSEMWLVRHGQTAWNAEGRVQGHLDIPLNEQGRRQARAAAGYIAQHGPWDAVISSPLARAYETATIIAQQIGVDTTEVDDGLKERYQGAIQGMTWEERERYFPEGRRPGKERDEDLQARVWQAMNAIARRHTGCRVVVASHGGALMQFLRRIDADAGRSMPNCSIQIVSCEDGSWRLVAEGIDEHLNG